MAHSDRQKITTDAFWEAAQRRARKAEAARAEGRDDLAEHHDFLLDLHVQHLTADVPS